jgi:UDPglucose 6-dehydrogenase
MLGITPKQKQILEFIQDYQADKGYSPTLSEIANHFKKATPTIHQHIKTLKEKGYLDQTKLRARGIEPNKEKLHKMKYRIGIIGFGFVGQAVKYGFSNHEIHIYDKYKDLESLEEVVKKSEFIFVCLPTPIKSDESGIDLKIMDDAVRDLAKSTKGTDKIIIIKSTVIPGTTQRYINKYKENLFCFNPEFLRESSFLQDFVNSDRVILGATNDQVLRRVGSLYQNAFPTTPIFQTDPTTAEMAKYMANCFFATKVTFANEMYDICQRLGINYEEAKKMVVADKRIYDSHLDVTS